MEPDSQTYHFLRAFMFSKNHTLMHFDTNDIRALIMPINSEIMYSWVYTLSNKLYGYSLFTYISLITAISVFWAICERFKISFRRRLFAIFVFCSFPCIIAQSVSLQTDIIVGVLLLISFYLYIRKNIYFSSLSLAVALGVKSTAPMALLGAFVMIILYEKLIEKQKTRIFSFIGYLILNFFIFSSYNYILNFLHYGNPLSNQAALLGHGFWGGIKGYVANLVNFSFQLIDSTGFKWGYYLNDKIIAFKELVFNFIHIDSSLGSNVPQEYVNISSDEQITGYGIVGLLVILPSLVRALFLKTKNNIKRTYVFICAVVFLINILILARAMAFMIFSIRFTISFLILSFGLLLLLYSKKCFYKVLISVFALFYMTVIALNLARAPFFVVWKNFAVKNHFNINQFVKDCYERKVIRTQYCAKEINDFINKNYPNAKYIAYFKTLETTLFYLKTLKDKEIDFLNAAYMNFYDLSKYDLIIVEDKYQSDNVFRNDEVNIDYKLTNGTNLVFENQNKIKCFYNKIPRENNEDNPEETIALDKKEALRRMCLGVAEMKKNPVFKFDKILTFELERQIPVYFFIKSN